MSSETNKLLKMRLHDEPEMIQTHARDLRQLVARKRVLHHEIKNSSNNTFRNYNAPIKHTRGFVARCF